MSINLTNWKWTDPTSGKDYTGNLNSFNKSPWFVRSSAGVRFRCHAGGKTTSGSSYPRSELREMSGSKKASWTNKSGVHVMDGTLTVTSISSLKRPVMVVAQVHDASDDVVMIRAEGTRGSNLMTLVGEFGRGKGKGGDRKTLGSIRIGQPFSYRILADRSGFTVYINGHKRATSSRVSSGLYYKAGCYLQTNRSKGESSSAFGEVFYSALRVSHGTKAPTMPAAGGSWGTKPPAPQTPTTVPVPDLTGGSTAPPDPNAPAPAGGGASGAPGSSAGFADFLDGYLIRALILIGGAGLIAVGAWRTSAPARAKAAQLADTAASVAAPQYGLAKGALK